MNGYILTLLAASLSAAVVELISPRGEGGRIASHVRMIAGLFLLVTLLSPLSEGIALLRSAAKGDLTSQISHQLPDGSGGDYEAAFEATLSTVGREETEAWVTSALEAVFGVPPTGGSVQPVCEAEGGTLTLAEIRISLHGVYAARDPHAIETYITEQLGCPCYVTVAF